MDRDAQDREFLDYMIALDVFLAYFFTFLAAIIMSLFAIGEEVSLRDPRIVAVWQIVMAATPVAGYCWYVIETKSWKIKAMMDADRKSGGLKND